MSTRASKLFIPETGEHWWEELLSGDEGLVLTFDKDHLVETDFDGTCITIKKDTPLYKAFFGMLNEHNIRGVNHGFQKCLEKHNLKD